jgi:hypothetical protein
MGNLIIIFPGWILIGKASLSKLVLIIEKNERMEKEQGSFFPVNIEINTRGRKRPDRYRYR